MRALVRLMTVPAAKRDDRWLEESLQAAIELEMSTIPPYLYAAWSIDRSVDPSGVSGDPSRVRRIIRGIVMEEMRHMGLACNLLASIGGKPNILGRVPRYPTRLPKDVHAGLWVTLAPLSRETLLKFMAIEEPAFHVVDDPDFVPSGSLLIGQFYDEVLRVFDKPRSPAFSTTGQVDLDGHFGPPSVFTNLSQVHEAIGIIKRQGEGTSAEPFEADDPNELAHFYQFGEMFHGRKLTRTSPFTYTGDEVKMPRVRPVSPADAALPASKAFNVIYSGMLRDLQRAWDGGGGPALDDAIGKMLLELPQAAETLIGQGSGPAFILVNEAGDPAPPRILDDQLAGIQFARVKEILDVAVKASSFGGHGPFWRGLTRDQFVEHKVFGEPLLIVGNGRDSNLVKALRGQFPFGSDTGTADAIFRRMPAGRDPVPPADIDAIEQWINDGCPDTAPMVRESRVSLTTGAFRPDPSVHNAFFRDLDDWSMFHATPDVVDAIDTVFGFYVPWRAFARDAALERPWIDAISSDVVQKAVAMLAARQQHTVEAHYGVPVPLLTLLDGFERFGSNVLPPDPLRPEVPKHNMNFAGMWFRLSAFANACVHLEISTEFWVFYMRAILCGLLNDGLFRHRFPVVGFEATPEGRLAVFQHAQDIADAELPGELRKRCADSNL